MVEILTLKVDYQFPFGCAATATLDDGTVLRPPDG